MATMDTTWLTLKQAVDELSTSAGLQPDAVVPYVLLCCAEWPHDPVQTVASGFVPLGLHTAQLHNFIRRFGSAAGAVSCTSALLQASSSGGVELVPWFAGTIKEQDAVTLLASASVDSYLARWSGSDPMRITLSWRAGTQVRHMRIDCGQSCAADFKAAIQTSLPPTCMALDTPLAKASRMLSFSPAARATLSAAPLLVTLPESPVSLYAAGPGIVSPQSTPAHVPASAAPAPTSVHADGASAFVSLPTEVPGYSFMSAAPADAARSAARLPPAPAVEPPLLRASQSVVTDPTQLGPSAVSACRMLVRDDTSMGEFERRLVFSDTVTPVSLSTGDKATCHDHMLAAFGQYEAAVGRSDWRTALFAGARSVLMARFAGSLGHCAEACVRLAALLLRTHKRGVTRIGESETLKLALDMATAAVTVLRTMSSRTEDQERCEHQALNTIYLVHVESGRPEEAKRTAREHAMRLTSGAIRPEVATPAVSQMVLSRTRTGATA